MDKDRLVVYVVTGVHSDMDVVAVYTSREKAEERAKLLHYGEVTKCVVNED